MCTVGSRRPFFTEGRVSAPCPVPRPPQPSSSSVWLARGAARVCLSQNNLRRPKSLCAHASKATKQDFWVRLQGWVGPSKCARPCCGACYEPMPVAFSQPCHPVIDRPRRTSGPYASPTVHNQSLWPGKDEYGRDVAFTGEGFKCAADVVSSTSPSGLHPGRAKMDRMRSQHSQAGAIISYGTLHRKLPAFEPASASEMTAFFQKSEMTMPGDLLVHKTSLPIRLRMAALIRQRSMDVPALMSTFLRRAPFSRMPQRGFSCIDVPTFRRALSYVFGEQWSALAMTSDELVDVYSPYVLAPSADGTGLISWGTFAAEIMSAAGLNSDHRGYLQQEASLGERLRHGDATGPGFDASELRRAMDLLYSHDIETEEEKQTEVLKDIERVTGARSVAVTRYGSYESKLHGRNQAGTIKQGDFERIGGHGDYRELQGVAADGSNVKAVNTAVASQSHEYAADGQTIVDDGSVAELQATLTYDASAAAKATPYADDRRPRSAPAKRRSASPKATPRGTGSTCAATTSGGTPREQRTAPGQRSARGPGAEKYKAVGVPQPGQFHARGQRPSGKAALVLGSRARSQVSREGRWPTPRLERANL